LCVAHRLHIGLCVELHSRPEVLVAQHPLHGFRVHFQIYQSRRQRMPEVEKTEPYRTVPSPLPRRLPLSPPPASTTPSFRLVASLDRKRLGADFWGGAGISIRGFFDEEAKRGTAGVCGGRGTRLAMEIRSVAHFFEHLATGLGEASLALGYNFRRECVVSAYRLGFPNLRPSSTLVLPVTSRRGLSQWSACQATTL
jgi:hypothetical protein